MMVYSVGLECSSLCA